MSIVNTIVDRVYVINLDKDKERMNYMDTQCKQNQINYVRFSAVLGANVEKDSRLSSICQTFCTDGAKGCALSHHGIWEQMLKENLQTVLILEDDVTFTKDLESKLQIAFREIPQFDVIYLCNIYNPKNENILSNLAISVGGFQPEDHTPLLKKVKGGFGTGAYIIHQDFVRKIIDKPITQHIDYQLSQWLQELNGQAYAFTDFAVKVDESPFESNLADSFPIGLNSILKQVKFQDTPDLSWILNENVFKLGPFNLNILIVFLMFAVFMTPKRFLWRWGIWLLLEGLLAKDIKNTLRYGVFLGSVVALRLKLR
jgi:GR25 family glycosyltransferase involved in LPS biosynthesis